MVDVQVLHHFWQFQNIIKNKNISFDILLKMIKLPSLVNTFCIDLDLDNLFLNYLNQIWKKYVHGEIPVE